MGKKKFHKLMLSFVLFSTLFLGISTSASAITMTVDFDTIDTSGGGVTGSVVDTYLAGFGISVTNTTPNSPVYVFPESIYIGLNSSPNYLEQWWSGNNGTS